MSSAGFGSRSSEGPWAWRPSKEAWYRRLQRHIEGWHPNGSLCLKRDVLVPRILAAAEQQEEWLFHPLINPLTLANGQRLGSDFQLAVWIALHSTESLGTIQVPEPLWMWTRDGGGPVEPGKYELRSLAAGLPKPEWPFAVALDVWSDSIGFPYPQDFSYPDEWSWSTHRPLSSEYRARLEAEVRGFMSAMEILSLLLPECGAWTASVTRVAIPLCRELGTKFKSGSRVDLPGVVFFDLHGGEHQILEALVHESAHQHMCVEEANGPLIDPAHDGRYASPLRPEPRPLRGILLAYHALVYMCSYYSECIRLGIGQDQVEELAGLRQKTADGEQVLAENTRFLTPSGQVFFERTREILRHVTE